MTDAVGRVGPEELHDILARAREFETVRRRTNCQLRAAERETSSGDEIEQVLDQILAMRVNINDRVRALACRVENLLKESVREE
jgi:hypothetical protein